MLDPGSYRCTKRGSNAWTQGEGWVCVATGGVKKPSVGPCHRPGSRRMHRGNWRFFCYGGPMRGRKPKATLLKKLHGSEQPRNPLEPQPVGDLSEPPAHFNEDQRAIWQQALAAA